MAVTRLFVTAWPTPEVVEHVRRIDRAGWRDVRSIPEQNWHITLRFIGDAEASRAVDALRAATLPRATARVVSQLEVLDRTSLVVPVDGLDELATEVWAATRHIGRVEPSRRFRGHLTVGRSRGKRPIADRQPIASADRLEQAIEFVVDEVALVASELSPQGARYTTVATFTTSGGGAR
jgi:2'-5' RNA ligase